MSNFLPPEVMEGLQAAKIAKRRKASGLRVRSGKSEVPVLRVWDTGFAVQAEEAAGLHGLVDLSVCLIVATEDAGGERRFEFKRTTRARDQAPLDFARDTPAPAGYLAGPEAG